MKNSEFIMWVADIKERLDRITKGQSWDCASLINKVGEPVNMFIVSVGVLTSTETIAILKSTGAKHISTVYKPADNVFIITAHYKA